MMNLLENIVARAKANKQRIVLPEAEEERTLKAADKDVERATRLHQLVDVVKYQCDKYDVDDILNSKFKKHV